MSGAKTTKTEANNLAKDPTQASRPYVSALKYYIHDGTDAFRFQLIGELREADVKELSGCWETAKSTFGSRKLVLDLRALASTDENGKEWLLAMVREKGLKIERLLETHVHADHLTASKYLQNRLAAEQDGSRPQICIGKRIVEVQERFATTYDIPKTEWETAFDKLLDDDEVFSVGGLKATALHLPGHTPEHLGYLIGCE